MQLFLQEKGAHLSLLAKGIGHYIWWPTKANNRTEIHANHLYIYKALMTTTLPLEPLCVSHRFFVNPHYDLALTSRNLDEPDNDTAATVQREDSLGNDVWQAIAVVSCAVSVTAGRLVLARRSPLPEETG